MLTNLYIVIDKYTNWVNIKNGRMVEEEDNKS